MMCGLINFGATCYLNTALQCLYASTNFKNSMLLSSSEETHPPLFAELKRLFRDMEDGGTRVLKPKAFLRALNDSIGSLLYLNEQNDINEFLAILIDKLNMCVSQPISVPTRGDFVLQGNYNLKSKYDVMRYKVDYAWLHSHAREMSPLTDALYGQTISQILCGHCKKIHHNYETFSILMLAIPPSSKQSVTLDTCLKHHFQDHVLNADDHSDKWKCDKCAHTMESTQSLIAWRTPSILMISIKRFDAQMQKDCIAVKIPEILDMAPWTLKSDANTKYKLKSIGIHIGSYHGGHYYAVVKDNKGAWIKIDDDTVIPVTENDFDTISRNGYVYVYEHFDDKE
jgi:ubiquitin C-terminal hydrolase